MARRDLCNTDNQAVSADYTALLDQFPQLLQGLHSPEIAINR